MTPCDWMKFQMIECWIVETSFRGAVTQVLSFRWRGWAGSGAAAHARCSYHSLAWRGSEDAAWLSQTHSPSCWNIPALNLLTVVYEEASVTEPEPGHRNPPEISGWQRCAHRSVQQQVKIPALICLFHQLRTIVMRRMSLSVILMNSVGR